MRVLYSASLLLAFMLGCASQSPRVSVVDSDTDSTVRRGDCLLVTLSATGRTHEYRAVVDYLGQISLPNHITVDAAGSPFDEIARSIVTESLRYFPIGPEVTVSKCP